MRLINFNVKLLFHTVTVAHKHTLIRKRSRQKPPECKSLDEHELISVCAYGLIHYIIQKKIIDDRIS